MTKENEIVLDVNDRPGWLSWIGLSLQHMFSMFGSTVIVPLLVGLSPSIALFASGIGTLLHILITREDSSLYGFQFCICNPHACFDENDRNCWGSARSNCSC